jgi:hypothetical protein
MFLPFRMAVLLIFAAVAAAAIAVCGRMHVGTAPLGLHFRGDQDKWVPGGRFYIDAIEYSAGGGGKKKKGKKGGKKKKKKK